MDSGIAGQTGLHVLVDIKQDKDSATIQLLKMGAAPVWALLQKHLTVKEGRAPHCNTTVGCTQREF